MKNNVRFFVGPHNITSERIEQTLQEISRKYPNIEVKRYYGGEFNPDTFADEIFENSLFVEGKVIIVHQIEEIEKKIWENVIFPALGRMSGNVFVIFEGLSVKTKPQNYEIEYIEDVENLFRKIYKKSWQRKMNAWDIYEMSRFLKENPYEFAGIIGIISRYLENLLMQKIISQEEFVKKMEQLMEIDFKLKSGKLSYEPGWETLLLNLLDIRG
ncbi:MAG: hypothetical protein N2115_07645 [bacterium]|nr:hypothetical protein [bacterium]